MFARKVSVHLKANGAAEFKKKIESEVIPLLRKRQEFLCQEATFRTLAEAIATAIFVIQGKRLHFVNHAAEVMTGYGREELLSMNFWDLIHPDTREPVINRSHEPPQEIGPSSRGE